MDGPLLVWTKHATTTWFPCLEIEELANKFYKDFYLSSSLKGRMVVGMRLQELCWNFYETAQRVGALEKSEMSFDLWFMEIFIRRDLQISKSSFLCSLCFILSYPGATMARIGHRSSQQKYAAGKLKLPSMQLLPGFLRVKNFRTSFIIFFLYKGSYYRRDEIAGIRWKCLWNSSTHRNYGKSKLSLDLCFMKILFCYDLHFQVFIPSILLLPRG